MLQLETTIDQFIKHLIDNPSSDSRIIELNKIEKLAKQYELLLPMINKKYVDLCGTINNIQEPKEPERSNQLGSNLNLNPIFSQLIENLDLAEKDSLNSNILLKRVEIRLKFFQGILNIFKNYNQGQDQNQNQDKNPNKNQNYIIDQIKTKMNLTIPSQEEIKNTNENFEKIIKKAYEGIHEANLKIINLNESNERDVQIQIFDQLLEKNQVLLTRIVS